MKLTNKQILALANRLKEDNTREKKVDMKQDHLTSSSLSGMGKYRNTN